MKALLAASLLLGGLAWAGGRQVTLVFTGDNRGEVAPCGCRDKPTGGLARRKAVLAPLKGALVFDAGNALFKAVAPPSPQDKKRASFILQTMGRLGTRAMAVGERDLPAGPDFLLAEARAAGVRLLSANTTLGGKRLFDGSAVLSVAGAKVALIGVSGGELGEVQASSPLEAVRAELAALGPRDLTFVVAALPRSEAVELGARLSGQIDGMVQSSDAMGSEQPAYKLQSGLYVFGAGQLGERLGKLTVSLDGEGPLVDSDDMTPERAYVLYLEHQVSQLEDRIAETKDPAALRDARKELAGLKQRRDDYRQALSMSRPPAGARTFTLQWLLMGNDVKDDPAIKAQALTFEPTYAGSQ